MQNRTSNQVTELQNLAEIQFSRANRLGDELNKIRKDNKEMRRKMLTDNKENVNVEGGGSVKDSIKGKMTEEQDLLRHQLQEQMRRHAEAMEHARMQSEGTIESLRRKMNALQDVLVSTGEDSNPRLSLIRKRSRSSSPGKSILETTIRGRERSKSPTSRRSYLAQRPRSRSRSYERSHSPLFPERDIA